MSLIFDPDKWLPFEGQVDMSPSLEGLMTRLFQPRWQFVTYPVFHVKEHRVRIVESPCAAWPDETITVMWYLG